MSDSIDNTTPGLRLMDLLERLVREGRPLSLPEAVAACGWPKPTVHRMLVQLEAGGWLQREPDGRRYALAPRLLRLSEDTLGASTQHGVRHAVLRQLVTELGESCNLTALSGAEVVYLDRVESAFPLRLELRPGTRVPLHCSASGKLFLAHLGAARRQALLDGLELSRHTATTLTRREALEAELATIRRQGHAFDAEEFVDGLVCIAVPVRAHGERGVRCALALQAPSARVALAELPQFLPRLTQAAQAIARTL
ncbi:MAG: IclR family transcriptional regulator [Hydrogenophaga sp.]|jgi:IclR family transcriptional regulator, acetate operon repressor|uniref:IclR family transcriptional regulator n=1 Tax=Hydrogenophaga intermedia TaxID=65786 RepID=UPI0020435832|nr:IclR family transcriptional regulator [Hydrogenophaga intermedia]MCM3563087.1 IclR family transcriptional regulator [Hydrogenophaga intermedia]